MLGVAQNASAQDIKQAYLKLARRYHPDRTRGDEKAAEVFRQAARAYEVLSRTETRYAYDMELGVEPAGPAEVPTYRRIAKSPLTGTAAGDYVEGLVGGLRMPVLEQVKEREYRFSGLDDPGVRKAYEQGMFGIGRLERSDSHALYESGLESLRKRQYDQAVACCVEAVKANPVNIQYRFALGCALEGGELLRQASREYETILKLARRDRYPCLPVREALIAVYLRLGKRRLVKKHCKLLWGLGLKSAVAEDALKRVRAIEEARREKQD